MAELTPYATAEDLAAFWRVLTATEITRAESLLVLASNRLRLMADDQDIDLDAKAAASTIYASNLQYVVMEAVKRAMLTPTDQPPVDTFQQSAGPYSENYKYSNPSGDLWFKKTELSSLRLYGTQSLDNISTTRGDIYS